MAEKIVSPGVFTRENDLSFVQQGVGAIGAAIIGPTVKGQALIPTQVFSYSEYQAKFGDSFKSGSDYYQYFTSICAKEYLKHGGPLTVVRVLAGSPTRATANVPTGSFVVAATAATSLNFVKNSTNLPNWVAKNVTGDRINLNKPTIPFRTGIVNEINGANAEPISVPNAIN